MLLKLLTDIYITCNQQSIPKNSLFWIYFYIETNELLSPSQYGFQEWTSTEIAINEI